MKNLLSFLVVILTTLQSIYSQDYAADYGKFKIDAVNMKSYDPDKNAEALVLYDIGNTSFSTLDNGIKMTFERSSAVKIFNKAGISYSQIEIPYYVDKNGVEEVYDIEGYTYNLENGVARIKKLDPSNVYDEKQSEFWHVKKFVMPDVKEGSVIEYRYKIISDFFVNLRNWNFQNRIPVVYSEYTTRMIPFYEYNYTVQGASKFDVFKNYEDNLLRVYGDVEFHDNVFVFGMKNIPAFRDEDFITSINDYIMKIDFQLSAIHKSNGTTTNFISTWPLLIQELLKISDFGFYMKNLSKNAQDILSGLSLESKSDMEKSRIIYDYVKYNYRWNGYKSYSASKGAKDFLRDKSGNSSNINLLLAVLLHEAGIESFPVLLSTRDHGKILVEYPYLQYINYTVVFIHVNNQDILLDATEPLCPFGMLPSRCINDKGLIVNKDKIQWIPLQDGISTQVTDSIHIRFNQALDSVNMVHHLVADGHKGLDYRKEYQTDSEALRKEFSRDGMEVKKEMSVQNDTLVEKQFICNFSTAMEAESVGDKLLVLPFPSLTPTTNPLKLPFRTYPVDMIYSNKHAFFATIDIPVGYKYMDQNKKVSVDNDLVNIQYNIEEKQNSIVVTGFYEYKKPVYLKLEYYDLKSFITKIVETFNDKIVLVKI